jgi:hypothetical protein
MFKNEHVVPCESIHHHLFDHFFLFSTHYLKKKKIIMKLWIGDHSGNRKSMKNSWKHLHPFQIVYFWPVLTLSSNSAISLQNQLNNNFFFYPWWTDIIWSILYSKWDMYFQNRTCYIYEFLMSHNGMHYFLCTIEIPVVTEAPCDHLLWKWWSTILPISTKQTSITVSTAH